MKIFEKIVLLLKSRKFWAISISVFILCVLLTLLGMQIIIRQNPDGLYTREGIMALLSRESTVYFSDRKSRVGTFFTDLHRDYVTYDSIPQVLVNAVVAAEDKKYFSHNGIDIKAILYAMLDNLTSLSFKRGGSSLTQQTAKNLFPIPSRNKFHRLITKFPELINTFRLEKNFSKEEILEFYLNQFYVSGNGHGVAIAARYFFSKDLCDLHLNEYAFIAGCVKGPNQYNPFTAVSQESKETKLRRAHSRTKYVLHQMLVNNFINQQDFDKASSDTLEFKKGKFRYKLSTNLMNVQKFMETEQIQSLLDRYNISDFMSAGLNIYSTLDKDIQVDAEFGSYQNLLSLDIILNGYSPPPRSEKMSIVPELKPGAFLTGKICSLKTKNGLIYSIQLQFGSSKGWVTKKGLNNFLKLWNHHENGSQNLPSEAQQKSLFNKFFNKNDMVYCYVPIHFERRASKAVELEIGQRPELQGGTRVIKDGEILANVGGFENTGYDRVAQAERQFGSTFKPIVYAAALELGWSPFDTLDNRRQLFKLGNIFYFPRPYHDPEPFVSMAWAGKFSENIASVYLLYHLLDKLTYADFWRLSDSLVNPSGRKNNQDWVVYVRDSLGYLVTDEVFRENQYQKAVEDLIVDLTFEGEDLEAENLKFLPYGSGFNKERKKYQRIRRSEDSIRYAILGHCFLRYRHIASEFKKISSAYPAMYKNILSEKPGIFEKPPGPPWIRLEKNNYPENIDEVRIEGLIRYSTLKRIDQVLRDSESSGEKYSRENLFASQEFRTYMALKYITDFSRNLGVEKKLAPVLSFPLGSNDISLAEVINVYQTLKDGKVYFSKKTGSRQILIKEITLPDGQSIYKDTLSVKRVINEKTQNGITAILNCIVEGGTGSKIYREFRLSSPSSENPSALILPAYGKTGTTNDHKNGAFLGFIAGPASGNGFFAPEKGYTIGVYVGFDNNKEMRRRGFTGVGGAVSLDAWIFCAFSIAYRHHFTEKIDFLDLNTQMSSRIPLYEEEKYRKYKVNKNNGLLCASQDGSCPEFNIFTIKE